MVHSDDEMGWIDFAATFSSCTKTFRGICEKLVEFQRHAVKLRKQHVHMLGHTRNVDETSLYFDMPSNVPMEEEGAKIVLIRGMGNEKARMTVMLRVPTDGCKLPPSCGIKLCQRRSYQWV
jgi:hypothetical protein